MAETRTSKFHVLKTDEDQGSLSAWQLELNDIIFGAESRKGKAFDVFLIVAILISVMAVMLESVTLWGVHYQRPLYMLEWFFTLHSLWSIFCGFRAFVIR